MAQLLQFNQQRGRSWLKLIFSFCTVNENDTLFSEKYFIDELAGVWFRFQRARNNDHILVHRVSTAFKKHKHAEGSTVKIQIFMDNNICKEWICHELLTDWVNILETAELTGGRCYRTQTEITVLVTVFKTISFANLYDDTELVDFYLKTENSSVGVHKACLAAHSDVFKAMLTGEWKEKNESFINIQGISEETLQHLKDYMYLGILPKGQSLKPLLALAMMYMMDDLKALCIQKLTLTATKENLFSLLQYACDNKIPQLCFSIMQLVPDSVAAEASELVENEALSGSSSKTNETSTELGAQSNAE